MKIAAYYFPNFHIDERNEARHGKGWTEWELLKKAHARFPGHYQPKIPLWGYGDEARPDVMEQKIEAASECGIEAFVFDWYWYDGPFLSRCLDEGFLMAGNCQKLKFALMWANHDWYDWHPCRRSSEAELLYRWSTHRQTVGFVWEHIIENYLTQPNYWRLPDGLPYFSIYSTNRFIKQMGGVGATAEVLDDFRNRAKKAGLPGVHIGAHWSDTPDGDPTLFTACKPEDWSEKCGFSSYTSYNGLPLDFRQMGFPVADFDRTLDGYLDMARSALKKFSAPYYPSITVGFDASPRSIQTEVFENHGFPIGPILPHTPETFERALQKTGGLLQDAPPERQILFIEAWNEWTEGSYLEPDSQDGYAFLELVKKFSTLH